MMKILLVVVFLLFQQYGYSQNALTGTILPERLNPHVTLLNGQDSTIVASTHADQRGFFQIKNIPNGTYAIKFSLKGYQNYLQHGLLFNQNIKTINLDTVTLARDIISLKEVVVNNQTPIIERSENLLIFNVAESGFSSAINGIELLQMIPSVNIDDDRALTISGRNNVAVYINGKPSNFKGPNLLDYLKNLQSNNIDKIELLNGANAATDANSNGGIINIKFKKANSLGYSSNVNIGGSVGRNYSYLGGFNVTNKSQKSNWFINFDYQKKKAINEVFITRYTPVNSFFDVRNGDVKLRHNYSLIFGGDYVINTKHAVGLTVNNLKNQMLSDGANLTIISNNGVTDSIANTVSQENRRIKSVSGNLNYNWKINTVGAKFTTDFDVLNYQRTSMEDLMTTTEKRTRSRKVSTPLSFENLSPSSVKTYSAKADLALPLAKNAYVTLGAKAIWINTSSTRNINLSSNSSYIKPQNTLFNYHENVVAAYANYQNQNDKHKLEFGLRVEQTAAVGDSSVTDNLIKKDFFSTFPNVSYKRLFNKENSLTLSYRKGISRPKYEELNPFFSFLDPYTYSQGNPQLAPMFNHAFKLDYVFKNDYHFAFNYNCIKHFSYSVYSQNPTTSVVISSIQNYDYRKSFGCELNIPIKVGNVYMLNIYGQAVREFFKYTNPSKEIDFNESNSFSFNLNHSIKLPYQVRANLYMAYESPTVYGIYTFKPLYYCNIAIQKNIFSGKGSLRLAATDPFDTKSNRYQTQAFDLDLTATEKSETRSFRLTFSYQLGKHKPLKRTIKTEELDRIK